MATDLCTHPFLFQTEYLNNDWVAVQCDADFHEDSLWVCWLQFSL